MTQEVQEPKSLTLESTVVKVVEEPTGLKFKNYSASEKGEPLEIAMTIDYKSMDESGAVKVNWKRAYYDKLSRTHVAMLGFAT